MIRMENHLGTIEISESYFSSLVGNAASSCFGVVGMANSNARQGIRSFFNRRRSFPDQGVAVRKEGDGLAIDLWAEYLRHRQKHRQQGALHGGGGDWL